MIKSRAAIATGMGAPLSIDAVSAGSPGEGDVPAEIQALARAVMKRGEGIRTVATF